MCTRLKAIGVFVCAMLLMCAGSAAAQDRVALVVGNSDYRYVAGLSNPKHDARDIASALRRIGFEVVEGIDVDKRDMEEKVREFGRKLDHARTALFFYAGHGMQVAGRNHLLPIDAKLERAGDLNLETIDVSLVLSQMEAEQRVNIIILDACRNNPLARSFAPKLGARSASVGQGLASIQSAIGTLIAYATQPDNVALDGDGRNSPFTAALLKHINTPGLEISSLMKRVRSDVVAATRGHQVPWDHSSLMGEVVLVSAPAGQASQAVVAAVAPANPMPSPGRSPESLRAQVIDAIAQHNLSPAIVKSRSEVARLTFSPDSQMIAVGVNGSVELRSVETQKVIHTFGIQNGPEALTFSVDGALLAASGNSLVKVWDVQTGELLRTLTGHRGSIGHLAFDPDGVSLASADNRGAIKFWNVEEGRLKGTLRERSYTGHLADFSPDGRSIAWSGVDRMVTVWDIASKRAVNKLHGHKGLVTLVKFSPDSRYLASGSNDNSIKVWDLEKNRLLHTLTGHGDRIDQISFSPEGHWLASGAADNSVKIWNLETGQLIKSLEHTVFVSALAVSPDGQWLASADGDNRFMLWSVGVSAAVAGK
jgi:uncharacterized caspase-like protein